MRSLVWPKRGNTFLEKRISGFFRGGHENACVIPHGIRCPQSMQGFGASNISQLWVQFSLVFVIEKISRKNISFSRWDKSEKRGVSSSQVFLLCKKFCVKLSGKQCCFAILYMSPFDVFWELFGLNKKGCLNSGLTIFLIMRCVYGIKGAGNGAGVCKNFMNFVLSE